MEVKENKGLIDLQNYDYCPTLEELGEYVGNPVFGEFCKEIQETYKTESRMEYSKCSWEPGWNVKYKKSGKSLCTIYLREQYFTVLVVIGRKEKERAEELLLTCAPVLQQIYEETKEGNGQRWMMIDLEDADEVYHDVLRLIELRR